MMNQPSEIETEVLVVGYGGAGAAAAITAHDSGARVLILEKMPEGGGNTRLSVGNFQSPRGMGAADHAEALSCGTTGRDILQAYAEGAVKNREWIEGLGGETEKAVVLDISYPIVPSVWWPHLPGAEDTAAYKVKHLENQFPGEPLWQLLYRSVEGREIPVMTDTPARELITNEQGEVAGVIAEHQGQRLTVRARKAVILTCGGFEYDGGMKEAFLPFPHLYPVGNTGNTGDGIRMAQKAGAALWHMTSVSGYPVFQHPDYKAAFGIRMVGERFIYVNRQGRRFTDETGLDFHDAWRAFATLDKHSLCYPNTPAYSLFDETARKKGPLYPHMSGVNRGYHWSLDNSAEVSKGWIKKGKNIRELARQIGLEEAVLEDTLKRYNEYCKQGQDPELGRSRETLEPLDRPPFYAIELRPGLLNTHGGPRRDREARVISTEGKPIPRLYAAGELGSIWGRFPEGSGNNAESFVFGRLAGRNAAAEKPSNY